MLKLMFFTQFNPCLAADVDRKMTSVRASLVFQSVPEYSSVEMGEVSHGLLLAQCSCILY